MFLRESRLLRHIAACGRSHISKSATHTYPRPNFMGNNIHSVKNEIIYTVKNEIMLTVKNEIMRTVKNEFRT